MEAAPEKGLCLGCALIRKRCRARRATGAKPKSRGRVRRYTRGDVSAQVKVDARRHTRLEGRPRDCAVA